MSTETFAKALTDRLEASGLWPEEAAAILDEAKQRPETKDMTGRWDHVAGNYPPILVNILWVTVKHVAKEWLAQHAPLHWARPMFDEALLKQLEQGDAGFVREERVREGRAEEKPPTPSLQLTTPNHQQIPRTDPSTTCPDAPGGKHDFQPDEEYAQKKRVPASECICCTHCGEPQP